MNTTTYHRTLESKCKDTLLKRLKAADVERLLEEESSPIASCVLLCHESYKRIKLMDDHIDALEEELKKQNSHKITCPKCGGKFINAYSKTPERENDYRSK